MVTPALIGRSLRRVDRCASTNDVVWEAARAGEPEGYAVLAEEQTGGRGRHGRRWIAPPGKAILLSILLRPSFDPSRAPLLTAVGGLGAAEALSRHAGPPVRILWPNDVVVDDRKIAGVLVEMKPISGQGYACVLGVGINVNQSPEDFPPDLEVPAVSLAMIRGSAFDRNVLLDDLLRAIDARYRDVREDRDDALAAAWRARSSVLGRRVRIRADARNWIGQVEDVHPLDGVILRLENGTLKGFRGEHVESLRAWE